MPSLLPAELATPPDVEFIALQSVLAGHYSLERELGRGGMGIVYLAREVQLERPVAIKVLPPTLALRADLRERFIREARTSAKLSHPNIVPIFRVDEMGGFVFFVMAFIEGETLTQRVRERGPLTPAAATKLIQEIAWALAYAHARGVIHRDIKPDNILLEPGSGRALVTDFGIARVDSVNSLTEVGQVMGTAHFMSPEQAAGEVLDGRSDLYSLGVVAHFALTGKLPFDGPTVQSILAKHLTQPPPPVASVNPGVPRALATAVDRCLGKDPTSRYASGEALAEAVSLAQEQRRDTPAPLRVWLAKGDAIKYLYLFWLPTMGMSAVLQPSWSSPIKLLFPFVLHTLMELYRTRRVFAAGYDLTSLRSSLREHLERRNEELAYEFESVPIPYRVVRYVTYASLTVAAASAGMMWFFPQRLPLNATLSTFAISSFITTVGAFFGLANPGRKVVKRDYMSDLRYRFWNSAIGSRFARLAEWRLARRGDASQLGSRPTEMMIGMAAADLYAALPKAAQKELRDLPAIVKRLEEDARAMRKKMAQLNNQIAQVPAAELGTRSATLDKPGAAADGLAARRGSLAADLTEARDGAGHQLGQTVAALENIRLDLLRLQAGAGSTASVTSALDAARRIGAAVDMAIGSRDAANALLTDSATPAGGIAATS
ncbi:MAG: serine/threonine protein kinase [Gemmatimonadota bacterium]|nr:serine/threonine protein kinase [Gemmatimonadota bacterium]